MHLLTSENLALNIWAFCFVAVFFFLHCLFMQNSYLGRASQIPASESKRESMEVKREIVSFKKYDS